MTRVVDNVAEQAARQISAVLRAGEALEPADFERVGIRVSTAVKRILSQPGTGRIYRRRGRIHIASAPGQPPAVDTGRYRNSWGYKPGPRWVDVGTNMPIGSMLEYGTRYMHPRPHLRPALVETAAGVAQDFSAAIERRQRAAAAKLGRGR